TYPVREVFQARPEQEGLRLRVDDQADAVAGQELLDLGELSLQERNQMALVQALENNHLFNPIDQMRAQDVIDLSQGRDVLARRCRADFRVSEKADGPANQLVGLPLREVGGQNDKGVAQGKEVAPREHLTAVDGCREMIAEGWRSFIYLL